MADPRPNPEELEGDDSPEDCRPRGRSGLSLSMTLLGLGLAAWLLYDMRADFSYWLGGAPEVELGDGANGVPKNQADNVPARVQGKPGPVADRFTFWGRRYEIVAIRGTSILVRRNLPGPEVPLPPGKAPPPPDQAPFAARGRLLRDDSIPAYAHAFQTLAERGEAVPREGHLWVLLDGELPRKGWRTPAILPGLLAIAGMNVFAIVRYLRRRAVRAGA